MNWTSIEYDDNSTNSSFYLDDTLFDPPLSLIVFLSFCYGSISVVAVIGNGLVIWIILTSRRMRNVTNYYIANLALADIAIGLFAIPFEFQAALLQRWVLPHFMCAFCPFVKTLSICVSIFTLSAIALDRFMAIVFPLTCRAQISRMHFRTIIGVIWILGFVLSLPMALFRGVIPHPYIREKGYAFCTNVNIPEFWMQCYHWFLALIQYFIPLTIITFAYSIMGNTLWGATAPGNAQSERDANITRNKIKVIKMLVIVVFLFALCWLPLQVYRMLEYVTSINEYEYINIIFFGCDWLAMSNSCFNPFVYAIYNEKFKREFQLRLTCMERQSQGQPLTRELSGFESSRFDWKKVTMDVGTRTSVIMLD